MLYRCNAMANNVRFVVNAMTNNAQVVVTTPTCLDTFITFLEMDLSLQCKCFNMHSLQCSNFRWSFC